MSIELEKYKGKSTRHQCPACNDRTSFVRYIDTNTKKYLHSNCGKCNHESGCGYHYTPKQYFIDNPDDRPARGHQWAPPPPAPPKPMGTLPIELIQQSYSPDSNFVTFLYGLYGHDGQAVNELCRRYYLGATPAKEVIFWQVDSSGKLRTGKIMQYNPETGKRQKNMDWVHSRMIKADRLNPDYNLMQCFFGEHLLPLNPGATVAIVESEKTAIIASWLMPDYIWLAAGQMQGLNLMKCKTLAGRNVVLFPDLSTNGKAFELWKSKAAEIMKVINCRVFVSDLLEQTASDADRANGYDIADYLITNLKKNLINQI